MDPDLSVCIPAVLLLMLVLGGHDVFLLAAWLAEWLAALDLVRRTANQGWAEGMCPGAVQLTRQ